MAQGKILMEDSEREVIAVAVRPFGDADESLLAGGGRSIGWRSRTGYW